MFSKMQLESASSDNLPDLWELNKCVAREIYSERKKAILAYSPYQIRKRFLELDQLGDWLEAQRAILSFPSEDLIKGLVNTASFSKETDYQLLNRRLEIIAKRIGIYAGNLWGSSKISTNWEVAQRELAGEVLNHYISLIL